MVRFTQEQRSLVERAAQLQSAKRAERVDLSTWLREAAVREAQRQLEGEAA